MSVCSVRLAALDEESAGEDLLVETVALGETVALYGVGGAKVVETAIAAEVFAVAMVPVVGSSVEAVSLAETVVVVVDFLIVVLPETDLVVVAPWEAELVAVVEETATEREQVV